ncbi:hypothetical protein ASPBRDRAFT_50325 [Aspergillus brasiliensis CBS 101740]|uniref:Beta-lactamase-related domain-containing protein n=1 Tax=Aspergillus brasiliensis (strain CBS 101740 / IMI 381727 / IBT 21946) TaxID=767769 RepID=A0A1L9V0F8_ASPBC|nr:hypothetical protein ASPBRDRAFT_50325 [Aspergillus brasiliensis CBS 101740]
MFRNSDSRKPLEDLEKAFDTSLEDGTWPGVVVAATNKSGSFYYAKAFGNDDGTSDGRPLAMSSIMTLASMSKLLTTIAALQLVEKRLVDLETDVSSLIPTLASQGILHGWDAAGQPRIQSRKNAINLRNLLTHTSGAGYNMSNPDLARFTAYEGRNINCGIDWVGQLVERLAGQTLETYMQRHIWEPLGIERMSFWPASISGGNRKVRISVRDEASGRFTVLKQLFLTEGVTDCFGGQGIYASVEEFLKVLHSILSDDGKLLMSKSIAMMFQSHLLPASRESLQQHVKKSDPESSFIGIFDNNRLYDWGLGGMLTVENEPSGRQKNTLFWSGKPNLFWFIDRESDLCGVLGTQFLPPGDRKVARMIEIFQKKIYEARRNL